MWKRERVYVIMCVWEREKESEFMLLERERERERERELVYIGVREGICV